MALAIVVITAGGDPDRMVFGDGEIHRYIALNLTTAPTDVDPSIDRSGASLRYGRIGLPATLWIVSGGSPSVLRIAQPAVVVLAGGAAVAATSILFPGAPLVVLLALLAVPGTAVSLFGGFAEVPALGVALWAAVLAFRRRWIPAALLFAYAILIKETAGAVLLAMLILLVVQRERRGTAVLSLGLVPPLTWHVIVKLRFGSFPLLDPWLVEDERVAAPFIGLSRSLSDPASTRALIAVILLLAIGLAVLPLARRSVYGLGAALASLQLLSATPDFYRYIGDAARTGIFIQCFAFLALIAWRRPAWTIPEGLLVKDVPLRSDSAWKGEDAT